MITAVLSRHTGKKFWQKQNYMVKCIASFPLWQAGTVRKYREIVVNHRPRTAGVAKYGLGRTWKVMFDLITVNFLGSFSTKPIYVFGGLGLLSAFFSVIFGFIVIYQKFWHGVDMSGNPLLIITAVLMISTIQFILMGLLAELLVRTYHESQNRPTYVIREILEHSNINEGGK